MQFTKQDIISALVIGFYVALLFLAILDNIETVHPLVSSLVQHPLRWALVLVIPAIAVSLLYVAYRLSVAAGTKSWFQLGKFLTTGFGNLFVDLGLLNILIIMTGGTAGFIFAIIKGISFVASVVHSYLWNKFWTFHKAGTQRLGKEFLSFLLVAVVGLTMNVGVASVIASFISPFGGLGVGAWANVAAFAAAVTAFIWNFLGTKYLVFERAIKEESVESRRRLQ